MEQRTHNTVICVDNKRFAHAKHGFLSMQLASAYLECCLKCESGEVGALNKTMLKLLQAFMSANDINIDDVMGAPDEDVPREW